MQQTQHAMPPMILSSLVLSQETHPDPDPYFRERKYRPRTYLMLSDVEYQIAKNKPTSEAEQAEINRVHQRVMHPSFFPVDRTKPPSRVFVPDPQDEPSLNECKIRKTPEALFPPQWNRNSVQCMRYIHIRDRDMLLLQTDGACIDNGSSPTDRPPRAGYAFVCSPPIPGKPGYGVCPEKLKPEDATSNRAELIAVIAALGARVWWGEGFYKVVVATDSEYVVRGCTELCRVWQGRKWKTSTGQAVKNRDLWEELIWTIEWMHHRGCEVMFWRIPREWNSKADMAAKRAAASQEDV